MPTKYKRNSGTDLSLATSWSDVSATGVAAAAIPGAGDTVQFDAASLGTPAYTNALTCLGVTFNSASAAPSFGGTTTIGTGGWTTAVTNNLAVIFTGTLAVGTNNQTWTMYRTTANSTALQINAGFTGSSTITLATAGANKAFLTSISTAATFSGTVILGANTCVNLTSAAGSGSGAGLGNAATIQINGAGSGISSSTGTSTFVSSIVANNSWSIGVGTLLQAVNVTGTTTFGSGGAYTLTTAAAGTLTGNVSMTGNSHAITATAACTVAGALTLANTPNSNVLSGAAGALTISGATSSGSGSHTIRANGAGNVSISGTFDCGTGNQTFQTLSGAGTLTISNTLTMGAGSHTFNAGTAAITVSGVMTGSNGFTKSGANDLIVTNTGGSPLLTGTVTVSAGELLLGTASQTGDVLTGITLFDITSTSANMIVRSNTAFTFDNPFQGTGNALFLCTNASGITIPDSTLVNMNSASALIGSGVHATTGGLTSYLKINDFPAKLAYLLGGASPTGNIYYIKAAPVTHSGAVNIDTATLTATGTATANFYNDNGSAANTVTLSGAVSENGTAAVILGLRGTNSGDNTVSGAISSDLGITKSDSGKWILSGNNTFTGGTTLSGGTLVAASQNALQNSTLTWQTAGTTFTIDPALTAVTLGAIAGTATAGLTLTIPSGCTLSTGNNNAASTTWANPIASPGNLTKIGTGTFVVSGTLASFSSTMTLSAGIIALDSVAFGAMTVDHTTVGVRASKVVLIRPTVTGGYSFPAGFALSGAGAIVINSLNTTSISTGFTFPSGSLTNLTGTSAGSNLGAVSGLSVLAAAANIPQRNNIVNLVEMPGGASPGVLTFEFSFDTTGANITNSVFYAAAGSSHTYATRLDVINFSGTSAIGSNTQTANLYANQGTGPLILSGGIVRYSIVASYIVTLNLRGTSVADNEISGVISQSSGVLAIQKSDGGRWKLTGANSYTGAVTLSAGTLYCNNGTNGATSSLGSSSATGTVTLAGGTLELDGCDSSRSSSAMVVSANTSVNCLSGANGLRVSGATVNNGVVLTTDVASGATMVYSGTFTYGGVDSTNRFVKTGLGTLTLSSTTSTWANAGWLFTNGTVVVGSMANSGSASSLGASGALTFRGSITLSHTGVTSPTSNRQITLGDATTDCSSFTLSNTGSPLTLTAASVAINSTANPIAITFTNTQSITFNSTLADSAGGGVVSVLKTGSNTSFVAIGAIWSYTGLTTVDAGYLLFSLNQTLAGNVRINNGLVRMGSGFSAPWDGILTSNVSLYGGGGNTSFFTGRLAGAGKTITIDSSAVAGSGATLNLITSGTANNTNTGNTAINGYLTSTLSNEVVVAGDGFLFGMNNTTTVSSTGTLERRAGSGYSAANKARTRYYNLTLQAGSTMIIGNAA